MIADLDDIAGADLAGLADALEAGALSASDLVQAYLTRIEVLDAGINAFCHVDSQAAMQAAEESDQRRESGESLSPYDGIPIAVKDNIDVAGAPTSSGFSFRAQALASADAEVVARLRRHGFIPLGKTNMPEGAIGGTTLNGHFGRTENPWRRGFVPGGSSGGTAAAVAAGLVPAGLGTDSLGSIRIPSSYCGIAGFKPTFGLLPCNGLAPLAPSLDTIGPMARYVSDLTLIMECLAAAESGSTIRHADRFAADPRAELTGLRIGVVSEFPGAAWPDRWRNGLDDLSRRLTAAGVEVTSASLDGIDLTRLARRCLLVCEVEGAVSFESDLAAHESAFPGPLLDMLNYGSRLSAVQLVRAQREIDFAGNYLRQLLAPLDALILPATIETAFSFSDPVPRGQSDWIALANAARVPALSIPFGLSEDGLPMGLQILGSEFDDGKVLRIGELIAALIPGPLMPPDY